MDDPSAINSSCLLIYKQPLSDQYEVNWIQECEHVSVGFFSWDEGWDWGDCWEFR